jgi:hypothetical protein
MSSSLSISWFMSRTHPYFLTYNKCRQCGLFHMSASSPFVFHSYSLTFRHRRILTSEGTTLGIYLASVQYYEYSWASRSSIGFSTMSSCCDSDGSLQIPILLANCTSFCHLVDDRSSPNFPRLIDFFKYFSRDFLYNTGVASIRAGLLKKDSKGWQNDVTPS